MKSKVIKLYFDTEFTDLKKDNDLISIGIVTDDNDTFYAEFTDYREEIASEFTKKEVIPQTEYIKRHLKDTNFCVYTNSSSQNNEQDFIYQYHAMCLGDTRYIREEMIQFINKICKHHEDAYKILFVSDVCHYDFVSLIELLSPSGAIDLEFCGTDKSIDAYCHDINQDLLYDDPFDIIRESLISDSQVSDIRDCLNTFYSFEIPDKNYAKHNALWDAMVIKDIHNNQ